MQAWSYHSKEYYRAALWKAKLLVEYMLAWEKEYLFIWSIRENMTPIQQAVVDATHLIPYGRVTNYGSVAQAMGMLYEINIRAQIVWWILWWLYCDGEHPAEWQRVINKKWFISTMKLGDRGNRHIELLEAEWVPVVEGYVDMTAYGWYYPELLGKKE